MDVITFQQLTPNTGFKYIKYTGGPPFYELVAIRFAYGSTNFRIQAIVKDESGGDAFNVPVIHEFGNSHEGPFPYMGDAVEFQLGPGSYFHIPNDPPNRISIKEKDTGSDLVMLGVCAEYRGFPHLDAEVTFRKRIAAGPPPIVPPDSAFTKEQIEAIRAIARAEIVNTKLIPGE